MNISNWLENSPWDGTFFNGDWVKGELGTIDVIEPATQTVLARVGCASAQDVAHAARQAASAQAQWAKMSPREKSDILLNAASFLKTHFDAFSEIVAKETGGAIFKGQHEIKETITILQLAAGMAMQPNGVTLPDPQGRMSIAKQLPIGVVGVISPFNFPMVLSTRSVAPALATGNAVISKPDPQTPLSGGLILAAALEEAGLPKGLYHVMPGFVEAGSAVCEAPEIGVVAFTGSTDAGRKIGEVCGRNLKKVSLELGGNSALIVLEDADLDIAASNIAWGAYLHQGQICMASGRILVHESIAEKLSQKIVQRANQLPIGNPTKGASIGPLINQRQLSRVESIVNDSIDAGAVLLTGGESDGLFYTPTVLSNVKPGMRCFEEEIFGPVVNIVTFSTDEQAVALANMGDYGLAGSVLSPNLSRAMAIGEQLHVGLLHINDQTVNDECINPFGGTRASGNGSSVCGPADWALYTHWQWMTMKSEATPKLF
ncbi:Benzaldehyde dehydrogenase (NAD(+)) [Alteromonas sp. 38]|uniref:benzaldehyde dehydrogenase n=1 Tax=Alteromonas TaxID=226 RepID=UPI0012F313DE|nr:MULTISPECIES: benzaldehyde dehydrogenase [Alteromonas]CAD5254444.1 Benzaldehyde dehydrogenase (NAD(+)) [Alteromonas sp. 154]VXB04004.1 Benzaldehyde dehydrogenase (NAD(+)) [Alteromonas sp. 38]